MRMQSASYSFILWFICILIQQHNVFCQDPRNCSWVGINGMAGPYMPTDVCMGAYRPKGNGEVDLHSSKYVCASNGSFVYQYHYGNNSYCMGKPSNKAIRYTNKSHFNCGGGLCPYAIMRFYNKIENISQCEKDDTMWAEAIFTTYQCLHDDNNPKNWFKLTCSADGSQLISNAYNLPHCNDLNDSLMFHEGCEYKDKYIDVLHCDYWNPNSSSPTTSPTLSPNHHDHHKNENNQTILIWIVVLIVLLTIFIFIMYFVIKNKSMKKRENKIKNITATINEDGEVINDSDTMSDLGYDKIESQERETDDNNFISPQQIASNTPNSALLNSSVAKTND